MNQQPRIVIVGGGISGLAIGFRIRQKLPNAIVTILEAASSPGGLIGTKRIDGYLVEQGPNGLFDAKPNGVQLARDLGMTLLPSSESSRKNRFLFVKDQLHKLPGSPFGVLTTPVLSLKGRMSLLAEPFRKRRQESSDESIAAFARRRFGVEAAETFIDGLVTGIYAGDPEQLSVQSCLPRIVQAEAEKGSVVRGIMAMRKRKVQEAKLKGLPAPGPQKLWSFQNGLQELIDTLSSKVTVRCQQTVTSLKPIDQAWRLQTTTNDVYEADCVVLACPAYVQAELLEPVDADLAKELAAIVYNRIVVVALGYRQQDVVGPQDGFGYIAPQNLGRDVLGVQWCTSIYPDRAPAGCVLWRALCGGVKRGEMVDWPEEKLLRTVHEEMKRTIGVKGEPVFHSIVRWPKAIPQYHLGHAEKLRRIDSMSSRLPGLVLGGNSLRGVALADCAENGERIAEQVGKMIVI